MKNAYKILGLNEKANRAEIKESYLKLAKKYHPDLHARDKYFEKKFQEINAAYQFLLSKKTKKTNKITQDKITFIAVKAHPKKHHYYLPLSFEQAARGGRIQTKLPGEEQIISLNLKPATQNNTLLKLKRPWLKCPFSFPFFTKTIFLQLKVSPHPFFKQKGYDLYLDVPISLKEIALEEKITVPTFNGSVKVKLPKKINGKTELRLKGKGLAGERKQGDLYLRLYLLLDTNEITMAVKNMLRASIFKNPRSF